MPPAFTIRRANIDDAVALAVLGSATMLETYAHLLPGPDILAHCTIKHSPAHYAAWLTDPACSVWIAEAALGAPIGYLVLTPASLPIEGPVSGELEVQRIYVLHPFHADGIGHALMNLAIETSRAHGAGRLLLGVHNDNTRALAFYRRQGFEIVAARTFIVGLTVCQDSVLAMVF